MHPETARAVLQSMQNHCRQGRTRDAMAYVFITDKKNAATRAARIRFDDDITLSAAKNHPLSV